MIISQMFLSVTSMILQNCLFNKVCKKELKTGESVYLFNSIVFTVCAVLFGIGLIGGHISLFTIMLGVLFGVITALSNLYKMLSLGAGPMHITILITTSSMIIPTMSGVFFGESFSLPKLICVFVLIFFIYSSLEKSESMALNKKWYAFCALAFLLQGSIGVLQKIHQNSVYKSEINGLLFVSFVCSLIFSRIKASKASVKLSFNKKMLFLAVVCGVCAYTMNFLNLRLSGLLPSQLFFPFVNGSAIVLSSVMSVVIFKEKISRRQMLGLCGGILSLVVICIV